MLSGRERVVRALCLEEPDRVPFGGEGISQPTADIVLNRPCVLEPSGVLRRIKLWSEGGTDKLQERIIGDAYDLAKKLKLDFYRVHHVPSSKDPAPKMLGEDSWTFDGKVVHQCKPPSYMVRKFSTNARKSDRTGIEKFEDHVTQLEEETNSEIEESLGDLQSLGRLTKKLRDDLNICVYGYGSGGFLNNSEWISIFVKCLYVRPDLVARWEKEDLRRGLIRGSVYAELGCEVIMLGTDIAYNQGPMISPIHYRKFIMPHIRMQSDHFHKKGCFTIIRSDGNLWPIIDDYLMGTHVDGVREIQTSVMDRWKLKELYGDRICFNGNVDCQYALVYGSTSDAAKETKDCIEAFSPGGGHILSSSNSINQTVKPENFLTMLETCRRYGTYE